MALYTKRQFAEFTGLPSKDLSNYIKRGHVVLQGGKCTCPKFKCICLIDDSNEINRLFIDRRGVEVATTPSKKKEPKKVAAKIEKKETVRDPAPVNSVTKKIDLKVNELTELRKQREELANEKIEKENKLLDAKLAKISEEIVPKEVVIHIVVAQSEAVKGAFFRAADTFVTQFAAQNSMPREEMISWKKQLTAVVNEAVELGVKESKSNLKKLAKEFAGKKGKGERDDS